MFEDEEIGALKVYVEDVGKLMQRPFLQVPDHFHLSVNFQDLQSPQPTSSVETGSFDEEQWAAFLHLFRPLAGLNNDTHPYGFLRVRKLIERRDVSKGMPCGYLKHLLTKFPAKHMPIEISFGIDGKSYNYEGLFDLWMNAMEFHREPEKRTILERSTSSSRPMACEPSSRMSQSRSLARWRTCEN